MNYATNFANALVGVGESYFTVFFLGLLIQLDDRNREIEQLKSQLKNLELEKSFKGRPQLKPACDNTEM